MRNDGEERGKVDTWEGTWGESEKLGRQEEGYLYLSEGAAPLMGWPPFARGNERPAELDGGALSCH